METNNQLLIGLNQQIKELQEENRRLHTRRFPSSSQKNTLNFDSSEQEKKNKIVQDIAILQNYLHVFAFVKGRNVIVNERAANNLLPKYFTSVTTSGGKVSKTHLGAALQRHLIELVFRVLTNKSDIQQEQPQQPYILVDNKENNEILSNESKLELKILSAADKLLDLMSNLRPSKNTNNEFMLALSNKIRYDLFSSINLYSIENSERLYKEIQQLVLKEMNKYRTSLALLEKIKQDSENLAMKMVSLFYQFKILDIKEVKFFGSGTTLDRKTMDAGYFDDDEEYEYQIDICSFPLITMIGPDGEEQIVSKAKVLLRPKNSLAYETLKDVVLPLAVSAEQPSPADNSLFSPIDGYDVVQSMTSGCWRSGSSNCEPEKAQLRKERDELKKTCEMLLNGLESEKKSQEKQRDQFSKQQSELTQTCEKLQSELKTLNSQYINLSEERNVLEEQNKDGLITLTKLQTENEHLKNELINETREQQRRDDQRDEQLMELETKLVEIKRQSAAQIELYKDQIEAQNEQLTSNVEQKETLINEIRQLKQAAELHRSEEPSSSPVDDEFVLVD
ncbi:3563_t:CDS:1 [Ambispora gerdemannii]|uniref:3563_t:CDS:1 n=1 Tax=Ambispora gerdemannii TaxID=144530 RepID=A0A9N9C9I0_9GLOM|nr:3563_t:CDS:1 [Ambispora gerdemannii]